MKKSKADNTLSITALSKEEIKLIERINKQTEVLNRNNLTRTRAYLDFYRSHPEIHWAFLGHMVSRNGGWNMTDLKGEFLSLLLTGKEQASFFSFLERGNWLIFQDAYPQFLLYEESVKRGKSLFHLLSQFQVSTFMETIWNHFLVHQNRYILTMSLVINEQSYLEKRVVQNSIYKNKVLDTLEFKLQDLFSFTHILFPFKKGEKIKMVGQPLRQFESLNERILLGKRLYALLFQNKNRLAGSLKWAVSQPHTGSRQDYWPHLFHQVKEGVPGKGYKLRIHSCKIKRGTPRLFSSQLPYAWKDVNQAAAEPGDWFHDWRIIDYLIEQEENIDGEIEHEYCQALERLELAVMAKKAFSIRE